MTSGTVPDRYPIFLPARLPDRSKLYVPWAAAAVDIYRPEQDKEEVLQEDSSESDSDEFDM